MWRLLDSQIRGLFWVFGHPLNQYKLKTLIAIINWKLNQHFISYPILVTLHKDVKCLCYPNSSYGGLVYLSTWPEFYEMCFVASILGSDSNFIDVGANIGVYSLLAASISKKGRIVAFEPNPEPLKILYENILINSRSIKNITVVEKAVSDKNGEENFLPEATSETSHIVNKKSKTKVSGILKVSSINLDSYVKRNHILYLDMVKIDVEGAEYKVLLGAKNLLAKGKIGTLLIEINDRAKYYKYKHRDIIELLAKNNYSVYKFEKKGKISKVTELTEITDLPSNILAVHEAKRKFAERNMKLYLSKKDIYL